MRGDNKQYHFWLYYLFEEKEVVNLMKLMKQYNERNGEQYTDLFAVWSYEGKFYSVRVKPVFDRDYKQLIASAQTVPTGELLEKYL